MEEVLLSIIIGAIEGATSWLVRESLSDPSITADTPVTWGYVVSGDCQYIWTTSGGYTSTKSGSYCINSNFDGSQTLIECPDFIYYTSAIDSPSGTITPTINYVTSSRRPYLKYDGGYYYRINFIDANYQDSGGVFIGLSSGNTPHYYENSLAPQYSNAVESTQIIFSNSPTINANAPAQIYLPSTYNQEISFNDFRQLLIDWGNDVLESESVSETIPDDSVPTWEQLTSETETESESEPETEATEPDYQPFSIDYNEILSEDELESILSQETYQLDSQYHYSDNFPIETIPEEIETISPNISGAITATVNIGSDIISTTGLAPIYVPLAIFSIICYIIRGCR